MILMAATILDRAIDLGQLRGSDWAAGILLTASTVLLLALASARVWADTPSGWLLDRFQRQYALQAGGGVAALTLFGALLVACTAPGNAAPLPYLPLLNPVDLIVALALTGVALWLKRARNASLVAAGSWLRSACWHAGVCCLHRAEYRLAALSPTTSATLPGMLMRWATSSSSRQATRCCGPCWASLPCWWLTGASKDDLAGGRRAARTDGRQTAAGGPG